ncbi:MAG: hypothetical protein ACR2N3_15545 [Pyrinomonadaceae bacterium]
MGFFKSLFGGGDKPNPVKEMEGIDYSIIKMYFTESLTSMSVKENHNPNYPWTEEKQLKFFELFKDEKLIFDGEVGCMLIGDFRVNRQLEGDIVALLFKETSEGYLKHREAWGEIPESIGMLHLYFWQGKPCVEVSKSNVPKGQPSIWRNQNQKDRDAHFNRKG